MSLPMADRGGRRIVVDSHYHLLQKEWLPEPLWETLASHLAVHISGDQQQKLNAQEFAQKYFPMMWDPEGEHLLRRMDEVGIDVTVMLVDDFGVALGEAAVSIEGQNKAFADLARRHPDRLIACAGVDPRRKNAVKILRRCVEEWGMRGVKYHPDAGWDPDGRESYRLLEHIQEWGIQLGDTPLGPVRLDAYANPIVNVYIRRVERREGRLMNVVIDTYRDVSQFWKYEPAAFLAAPVYSRDHPPAKNLE